MRLACAGATNEYGVLRRIGKRQSGQGLDQVLINRGRRVGIPVDRDRPFWFVVTDDLDDLNQQS